MKKEFTSKGKNVTDALEKGCAALGVSELDVTYEVVRTKTKGFLGIGGNDAEIKIVYDDGEPEPTVSADKAPEEKPAKKAEKKEKKPIEKKKAEEISPLPEPSGDAEKDLSDFAVGLLLRMGIKNPSAKTEMLSDRLLIDLSGDNIGAAIGKHGETLDSVQYILSLYANKGREDFLRVTADMASYRKKREEALRELAGRVAMDVIGRKGKYTLEPMRSSERRIIHAALQDNPEVSTYSVGEEPRRRVVVEYNK